MYILSLDRKGNKLINKLRLGNSHIFHKLGIHTYLCKARHCIYLVKDHRAVIFQKKVYI